MNIELEQQDGEKILRIDIGRRLDLSAYKTFNNVTVRAVNDPQIAAIVIDFVRTEKLFDSGRAILLDLIRRAGYLKIPLRLINASPAIQPKLSMAEFPMARLRRDGNAYVSMHQMRHAL